MCVYMCHLYPSVTAQLHVCNTPECTFQRQDSSWACWTFACYQELRVKWRELIFCLLEVHSLGLAAHLLSRLAAMQRALFLPRTPTIIPFSPLFTYSLSLSAWRLPLFQLTLVLPLLGEMYAELLTPGLIFPFFPISSTSSSWRLWRRQRTGGEGGIRGWERESRGRIVNSHRLFKLTMFGAGLEQKHRELSFIGCGSWSSLFC